MSAFPHFRSGTLMFSRQQYRRLIPRFMGHAHGFATHAKKPK